MKVACAVLAAGASTRLGQPKQLLKLSGETLLERAVRTAAAANLDPVLVILGSHAAEIERTCNLKSAELVRNDQWRSGMASSLQAALGALPGEIEGLVVMNCDQPAVTADLLRRLVDAAWNKDGDAFSGTAVGSRYEGRIGVPAFFPATLFQELRALEGDEGARSLLRSALAVELLDGELDVDTNETWERAQQRFR